MDVEIGGERGGGLGGHACKCSSDWSWEVGLAHADECYGGCQLARMRV